MSIVPNEAGSSQSRLDFLRTELEIAATFIDIAQRQHDDAAIAPRNREKARVAYNTVLRFLPQLILSPAEQDEFDSKLASLKVALTALGEKFN